MLQETKERNDWYRRLYAQKALYDPERDGPAVWSDYWSMVFGDPPLGRRLMLEAWARKHPVETQTWTL